MLVQNGKLYIYMKVKYLTILLTSILCLGCPVENKTALTQEEAQEIKKEVLAHLSKHPNPYIRAATLHNPAMPNLMKLERIRDMAPAVKASLAISYQTSLPLRLFLALVGDRTTQLGVNQFFCYSMTHPITFKKFCYHSSLMLTAYLTGITGYYLGLQPPEN